MLLKTQDPARLKLLLSAFKATENPVGPSNVVSKWAQHRGRTVHHRAGEEREAEQHGPWVSPANGRDDGLVRVSVLDTAWEEGGSASSPVSWAQLCVCSAVQHVWERNHSLF